MYRDIINTRIGGGLRGLRTVSAVTLCGLLLTGCLSGLGLDKKAETGSGPEAATAASATTQESEASQATGDHPNDEVALDNEVVTYVQGRLAELGYEPGPVDGLIGRKTRGAVRRYQTEAGLPVNGKITETLLARLEERPEPAAELEPAARIDSGPAPSYAPGTRFVYTNGEVFTVAGTEGAKVRWHSNRGGAFVAYDNFVLPPLAWQSPTERGVRLPGVKPDDVWPLESGTPVTFTATSLVRYGTRPDNHGMRNETWRCRLEGSQTLAVRAGTFDTRKILCDGRSEPGGADLRRVWHYAPEIRHFVLYQESGVAGTARRRVELLAIQPSNADWPPVARAGLGWAIDHALETAPDGEETAWSSSAVDTEVVIRPGLRMAAGRGQTCRSFSQVWSGPDEARVYPGLACRISDGRWAIPGLEAGLAVAAK
jgi:hypothetical protein